MLNKFLPIRSFRFKMKLFNVAGVCAVAIFLSISVNAQQNDSDSVIVVQPGSPGKATKVLPADTTAKLPPVTKADTVFMQGMIHHHSQAVEMVALMKSRTGNKNLLLLGERINQTQAEEIKFMKRWLTSRGQKTSMQMPKMDGMDMADHDHSQMMLMPGMLTPKQMKALANAKSAEFDRLFLTGMIQHHEGALVMVDELFKANAGQDTEMFTFATDVDSTQRAEIRIMQEMLDQ